jgi:hypothetical protein
LEQRIRDELTRRPILRDAIVIRSDSASSLTKEGGSAEWTNALQNLLLELGIELGFHVFPRRRYFSRGKLGSNSTHDRPERGDDIGEYILDVSWTRYPRTIEWLESLRAPVGAALEPGLVLACEGEWAAGRFGKLEREEHVAAVLDDFAKLTDVRAARKVLIFAFQPADRASIADFDDIVALCKRAVGAITPGEQYLLLGWPFDAVWEQRLTSLCSTIF